MIYIYIIIGAILGVFVGQIMPIVSYTFSIYLSVAILAALDSVLGAIASIIKKRFDMKIFISGFFGNALITILLTYLGQRLNVDIYLAAIIVFVGRMFNNLAIIRRYYVDVWYTKYMENKKEKVKQNEKSITEKSKNTVIKNIENRRNEKNIKDVNKKGADKKTAEEIAYENLNKYNNSNNIEDENQNKTKNILDKVSFAEIEIDEQDEILEQLEEQRKNLINKEKESKETIKNKK